MHAFPRAGYSGRGEAMNCPVFSKRFGMVAAFSMFLAISCQDSSNGGNSATAGGPQERNQAPEIVEIESLDELMALFDQLNYNRKSWDEGNREVPHITFDSVSENWKKTSREIPVTLKKQVFFRLMAPLVLVSNENILIARQRIIDSALEDSALKTLAIKYKVIADAEAPIDEKQRQELLRMVDILPPSLVLAQAAEESGWASSRFTSEGNAFFGQWDFSGNGMAPAKQRKELGSYGLARFDSPLASVEGYMFNINTHRAYKKLRDLRAGKRAKNELVTGHELAGTLDKYSERGEAYIDGLREMIRFNALGPVDEAYLSDTHFLRLVPKEKN
jgi:Bax protein